VLLGVKVKIHKVAFFKIDGTGDKTQTPKFTRAAEEKIRKKILGGTIENE
jgi:hypothetical protein